MNNKIMTYGAVLIGFIFIILGVVYWKTPAGSLPHYLPGYLADSARIHTKHALGSFILGIAAFIYAWFSLGKKN